LGDFFLRDFDFGIGDGSFTVANSLVDPVIPTALLVTFPVGPPHVRMPRRFQATDDKEFPALAIPVKGTAK
jgi:hypothetical protein